MKGNPIGYPIGALVAQSGGVVTIAGTGTAAGAATVAGVIHAIKPIVGTAAGSSTVTGVVQSNAITGTAAGTSDASGVLRATAATRGQASGHATVLGVSDIILVVPTTGLAQGTSTVRSKGRAAGDKYYTSPRSAPNQITISPPALTSITTARSNNRQITA